LTRTAEATEPQPKDPKAEKAEIKTKLRAVLDEMIADYAAGQSRSRIARSRVDTACHQA